LIQWPHLLVRSIHTNQSGESDHQTLIQGAKFKFERINKDDAVLLVVDHQVGLFQLVRDYQPDEYRINILAHAALGKVFNLPTVLTTSAETGSWHPPPLSRLFCNRLLIL